MRLSMKKIIPFLRLLLAVSVTVCAAAFIYETACIYHEAASQMYTTAIISEHFKKIAWAPVIMLVMIIAGAFLPFYNKPARLSDEYRLDVLLKKVDKNDERIAGPVKKLKMIKVSAVVLASIACLALLIIGTRETLFVSMDLEKEMSNALPLLLIPVIVLFAGELALSFAYGKAAKEILNAAKGLDKKSQSQIPDKSEKKNMIIRIILYSAAVLLLILGIANGGMYDVFVKAVNICTECIGLG